VEAKKANAHVRLWRGLMGFPALIAVFMVAELFETIESKAGKVVRAMDRAIDAIDAWARR
jgi:hypothetical protein